MKDGIRAYALALLALAVSLPATAQLQLLTFDGTTERPTTQIVDLGTTAMGDSTENRFHARNNSASAIALQTLTVAGASFSFSSKPTLPYIVAPGNFVEFRVSFAPPDTGAYSASLAVNGAATLLRATAYAAPIISIIGSGPAPILGTGATIEFGRALKGTSVARRVHLANASTVALTISTVVLTGVAFHGPAGATFPSPLPPGRSLDFDITFDPKSPGQQTGTLKIDNRAFTLTGVGYDPPLPKPVIDVTGSTLSASQPKLSVKLADVAGTSGTGTLTLDFKPAASGITDDASILFVSTGSRRLTFKVNEGDSSATFNGQSQVTLQTGTTAGVMTLTAQLGDYTEQATINIPAAVVAVDQAGVTRRVSDIDVQIVAFDNTRTAGKFNFQFYDRSGTVVQPGPVRVDATADFGRYFAISRVGGAFLMRATFPVTGDASQIGSVEVELVNGAGTARTARLNLQ